MLRTKTKMMTLAAGLALTGALHAQDAQNMMGRQTQNEGFFAVPTKGAVKIDGKLDEWDLSGQIWSYADTSVRHTFSVKTAAMWDEENLYLSFVWRDPMPLNSTVNPEFDPERGWVADAVQLRVLADKQPSWFTAWGFENGTKPAVHVYYWKNENEQPGGRRVLHYTGKAGQATLGEGIESAYALAADGPSTRSTGSEQAGSRLREDATARQAGQARGFVHELKLPWKVVYNQEHKGAASQTIRMGMEFLWGDATGRTWPMHRYADNMQPGATSREFYWTAKNAWGNVTTLAESVKEPRQYVEGSLKPQGTIPVRAQVPTKATTFTLVIDDAAGNRVRNLAGGYAITDFAVAKAGDKTTVEVMWDGLDEAGKLVPPGTYKVRGLTQDGLNGYYEMSFYNPGTPPWETSDHRGAWGADHTVPRLLARSGDNTVIASDFAESGYGTFMLKPDGTKAWSEKRGANVLAASTDFVYTVPNDWGVSGTQLLRLAAKDGKFMPFVRDGKELPMPLPFTDLLVIPAAAPGAEAPKPPKARALAVADGILILATDDNRLWLFDANTAALVKQTTLELTGVDDQYPFAFDGKTVYFFRQKELVKVGLDALKTAADPAAKAVGIPLGGAVEQPGGLALDDAGNLYLTDLGKDLQVKKFTPEGKPLAAFGKPGGRARHGAFDPEGMREMAGLAVDAAGNVWVAECTHFPRRVSAWKPDGKLLRDFIGNTGYAGQGSFIHDSDPTRGVAELNEITLDPATHQWTVSNVMYNPDPARGDFVMPGRTAFGSGNVFFSSASGEKHEYFVSLGEFRNTPVFVMIKVGKDWQPVAGIFSVARLQGLLGGQYGAQIVKNPSGDYADNDACDMLIWNDLDNDGYVQKSECEIVPSLNKHKVVDGKPVGMRGIALPIGGFGGGGRVDSADFSFYGAGVLKTAENKGTFKYTPLRFRDGGRPVFGTEGIKPFPAEFGLMEAVPVPGKDLVVGFINQDNKVYVAGFTKSEGKILWKYLSPYHQVHGSHKAPMPKPGLLIGCLKIAGIVEKCGDADSVFMIRGNLGEDYYLTTDGVFVDILTKDGRIPGIQRPESEEELRAISFSAMSGRGEHFSGLISRQADGVVRCSGAIPADQACNIIRVEGLESIRRFAAADVVVDMEALVKADQDNTRRTLAAAPPREPYTIGIASKDGKGQVDWKPVKAQRIHNQGQPVTAEFRAAYDNENLYVSFLVNDPTPWKNSGNEYRLLFKTGDAVDFQLSPSGNETARAAAGDLRVVMANFNGKPVAVLMKQVAPDAPAADKYNFTSPVMTVTFDQVKLLAEVTPTIAVRGNGYTVTAALPWTLLGVEPKAGLKLRGDAGFILSDPAGAINVARIYWSNKSTNLVNDQPGEAIINPQGFGEFLLGKP